MMTKADVSEKPGVPDEEEPPRISDKDYGSVRTWVESLCLKAEYSARLMPTIGKFK